MFDMLENIFRNLSSKPATRMYPFVKREPFPKARGKVAINIDKCVFCGICGKRCPSDAISVRRAERTWEVDPFKCIICGFCADICPKKSIYMDGSYTTPAYAKKNSTYVQEEQPAAETGKETA